MSAEGVSERGGWSDDGELADEITLYGDLVVAASETDRRLTVDEIDTALGLAAGGRGAHGANPP